MQKNDGLDETRTRGDASDAELTDVLTAELTTFWWRREAIGRWVVGIGSKPVLQWMVSSAAVSQRLSCVGMFAEWIVNIDEVQ